MSTTDNDKLQTGEALSLASRYVGASIAGDRDTIDSLELALTTRELLGALVQLSIALAGAALSGHGADRDAVMTGDAIINLLARLADDQATRGPSAKS